MLSSFTHFLQHCSLIVHVSIRFELSSIALIVVSAALQIRMSMLTVSRRQSNNCKIVGYIYNASIRMAAKAKRINKAART